jgi:hypothetical protein
MSGKNEIRNSRFYHRPRGVRCEGRARATVIVREGCVEDESLADDFVKRKNKKIY